MIESVEPPFAYYTFICKNIEDHSCLVQLDIVYSERSYGDEQQQNARRSKNIRENLRDVNPSIIPRSDANTIQIIKSWRLLTIGAS